MSHSRTSNFTYRLIFFFFLAGKGGGGKKKRRHVVLLLFSLSKGNPGAAAWTWAHSDSEAGWKQDLRPLSLYLTVLRETPPPPNLSCHGPGPIFKRVTWALLDCELHLGSSQEARHCLWWIACAKTKRLRVCSEEIKAARWLSVSARTFFFVFSPHYQQCSEMVSPASTELSRPTSPGNHWVTQDREQDPTSASQHNHHTRYSIKASSCTPTLFPKNLQKKTSAKRTSKHSSFPSGGRLDHSQMFSSSVASAAERAILRIYCLCLNETATFRFNSGL